MKAIVSRVLAAVLALCLGFALLGAGVTSKGAEPNKLVILSTTDVKGKNEPCG